jgi:4-O-beta-D-mannosyl-D-glucose phosphorylase
MHVATSTIDKLVDYVINTAKDGLTSSASVQTLKKIIDKNLRNEEQQKKKNNDKVPL